MWPPSPISIAGRPPQIPIPVCFGVPGENRTRIDARSPKSLPLRELSITGRAAKVPPHQRVRAQTGRIRARKSASSPARSSRWGGGVACVNACPTARNSAHSAVWAEWGTGPGERGLRGRVWWSKASWNQKCSIAGRGFETGFCSSKGYRVRNCVSCPASARTAAFWPPRIAGPPPPRYSGPPGSSS